MKTKFLNIGTVFTAFLASLCCIGPIVLAALGLGGAGLVIGLEAYRPYFIIFTLLLLAGAFYYTYRKREVVCEDGTCKMEHGGKWSKISLWTITAFTILFIAFPYIEWTSDSIAAGTVIQENLTKVSIPVEGMTCSSCNTAVEIAVKKLDGVERVKADFQHKNAIVEFDPEKVEVNKITEAIDKLGYKSGQAVTVK
jgi:copper ion binding protein